MNIGIQAWGSRGDINPWIAIGQGLCDVGHNVTLFYTNYSGTDFFQYSRVGLSVRSTKEFSSDFETYSKVPCKKIYEMNAEEQTHYILDEIFDLFVDEIEIAAEYLCQNNQLIISYPTLYQTTCLAEKYNIPCITLLYEPQFSPRNKVNSFSDSDINWVYLKRVNEFRAKHLLSPVEVVRTEVFCSNLLTLFAYSKVFCKAEFESTQNYQVCGFLEVRNEKEYECPIELDLFFANGPAPIFFSMGSLTFFEGNQFDILDIFLEAVKMSGCRAIIQANWSNLQCEKPKDPNLMLIDFIPHELVFDKCLGVVHHGGAGTTHTTLLNGVPSIVIAYAWDQFYWGRELVNLGCCAGNLKRKYLDSLQLAGSIRKLMVDSEYKFKAEEMRRKIKRERSVAKAINLIEQSFESFEYSKVRDL